MNGVDLSKLARGVAVLIGVPGLLLVLTFFALRAVILTGGAQWDSPAQILALAFAMLVSIAAHFIARASAR